MKQRYRWDDKTQTFVEAPVEDPLRYEDLARAQERELRRQQEAEEKKAHPGVYL